MSEGASCATPADIAVSVTGIAGPDGGSPEKPIGLVYVSVAAKGLETRTQEHRFGDGRCDIRLASVREALNRHTPWLVRGYHMTKRTSLLIVLVMLLPAVVEAADVTVRDLAARLYQADRKQPLQLGGLDMRNLDLSGLDFKGATLAASNLFGSDLSRADLSKGRSQGCASRSRYHHWHAL